MNKEKPSKTPWEARGKSVYIAGSPKNANGYHGHICNCVGDNTFARKSDPVNLRAESNAEFIVLACNNFEAIIEIIELANKLAQEKFANPYEVKRLQDECASILNLVKTV